MDTVLFFVLPVAAIVATNVRPVWLKLSRVIHAVHNAGHVVFGGKRAELVGDYPGAGHKLERPSTLALVMGHPAPLTLGGLLVAGSFLIPTGISSALLLALGGFFLLGGINHLGDLMIGTTRAKETDALLLQRLTGKDASTWTRTIMAISFVIPTVLILSAVLLG